VGSVPTDDGNFTAALVAEVTDATWRDGPPQSSGCRELFRGRPGWNNL